MLNYTKKSLNDSSLLPHKKLNLSAYKPLIQAYEPRGDMQMQNPEMQGSDNLMRSLIKMRR